MYVYIYIYVHIHTYTYTYTYMCRSRPRPEPPKAPRRGPPGAAESLRGRCRDNKNDKKKITTNN